VRIPLHDHLVRLRQDYAREQAGRLEKVAYASWSHAWATPTRFRAFSSAAGVNTKLSRAGVTSKLRLPVVSRWTSVRDLPESKGAE
jgi:L-lactate utilization protein LutB